MSDLIRHELCHALANLKRGADAVTIQAADDGLETIAHWGQHSPSEDDVLIGFIAGQLYTRNVDTRHDQAFLSCIPRATQARLWDWVLANVAPYLHEFPQRSIDEIESRILLKNRVTLRQRNMVLH